MTGVVPTAEFASLVYGSHGVDGDDPAEAFHEASRLYPNVAPARLEMLLALRQSPELQQTAARSSRTHGHRPGIQLPRAALPPTPFGTVLEAHRSTPPDRPRALGLAELGAVLGASYAARPCEDGGVRRPVPSGGALYPVELYVLALRVDDLEPGALHYDPFRHRIERLGRMDSAEVGQALVDPSLAELGAALLVVTAVFWRSRFKWDMPLLHNSCEWCPLAAAS